MFIKFKDKEIAIKEFDCHWGDITPAKIHPSVNLFVKVTNGCNALCQFCSNAGAMTSATKFNIEKLIEIIYELQYSGIIVNKVNITGGEPSVVPNLVEKILDAVSMPELRDLHLHLNTNGLLPKSQKLMQHPRWNSISMSLHHYNLVKLSELYGCKIAEEAFEFSNINRKILNISCNLIKGYIDCSSEAKLMLDFAIDKDIKRIGFVALMKVNDFCREHFIDLEQIALKEIPHVYFIKSMNRGTDCKCSNYLYNKGFKVLEIYMRNYANPQYCESSLVYDGEHLRQGFHHDNIIY